ncbi:PAS domain-containing protein [Roseovarius atlanticus]|uniref:PAS domain-containing protein n=1 Tax=Roseovarius atlanticus TaxID=1641875 RepID=UPI00070B8FF3|nr:PAS domain-containing protein [Roseovarius atlanticus]
MKDDSGSSFLGKIADLRPAGDKAHTARVEADLQKFVSYWSGMRRGGDVPLRTEIDPRGIESLLSNAFIAEKVAPGIARLRIAGTHLSDVMGMEVRGMPLSALIAPEDRGQLADALVDLFERPATLRLDLTAPGGIRRAAMAATLVVLPLRSDLGDISRALGCFVTSGPIGSTPRRFKVVACKVTPLDLTDATATGFREEQARLAPPAPKARHERPAPLSHPSERPYLRLVHSD